MSSSESVGREQVAKEYGSRKDKSRNDQTSFSDAPILEGSAI